MMKLLIKILIVLVIAFMLLGAIMVFTASGTYSLSKFNNYYFLFKAHVWKVFLSLFFVFLFAVIPYDKYRKSSKWLLIGVIIALIATLIISPKVNGAGRWLNLGLIRFQPSEIAKIALIIHLAVLIERKGDSIKDFKNGFLFALIWIAIVIGLIIFQPHVSACMIITFTSFALLYVGGAKLRHIMGVAILAACLFGLVIMTFEHARERVLDYINSLITGKDINVQVTQSKIALGSGGLAGLGLGHSKQSDLFLPESYSDFIFSVIGEELGFVGTIAILFIYFLLFLVCLIIAKKAQDKLGQLLVFGLSFNILISAFINAGVATGLLPTTGITLPFISFGGTSIILLGVSVGIIINVAQQTLRTEELKLAQVG